MEYDDRTVVHISDNVLKTLLISDFRVEVPTQHIPHDDSIMTLQELHLLRHHSTIWRSEQSGIHQMRTLANIVKIRNVFTPPAIQVIERMIAHSMTGLSDVTKNVWVFFDILSDAEKSSFCIKFVQLLQDPGCYLWNWPVVKC